MVSLLSTNNRGEKGLGNRDGKQQRAHGVCYVPGPSCAEANSALTLFNDNHPGYYFKNPPVGPVCCVHHLSSKYLLIWGSHSVVPTVGTWTLSWTFVFPPVRPHFS